MMGARFEGDINSGTLGRRARSFKRLGLGMGASAALRPAAPNNSSLINDNASNRRVGPNLPETALGQFQRG